MVSWLGEASNCPAGVCVITAEKNVSSVIYLGSGSYRISFSTMLASDHFILVGSTSGAANLGEKYPVSRSVSYVDVVATDGAAAALRRGGSVTIFESN